MLLATPVKTKFNRQVVLLYILPTLAVFIALLAVTFWAWQAARDSLRQQTSEAIRTESNNLQHAIDQRFRTYQEVLRGGSGLFAASNDVTREQWKAYVATFQLEDRYPGVLGIGYIQLIPANQLDEHIAKIRGSGLPQYQLYPAGTRSWYSSVVYLEPANADNQTALGFDMYENPVRRKAMDAARDSNQAKLSDKLFLAHSTPATESGFLMFVPIYEHSKPISMAAERQAYIQGFTYAPFRANDFFNSIRDKEFNSLSEFQVYSGMRPTQQQLLYESGNFKKTSVDGRWLSHTVALNFYGQAWTLIIRSPGTIVSENLRSRPALVLLLGLMATLLVTVLIFILVLTRTRSLASTKEEEVQSVKDELLSLASHQLRTPATAVKQYIGMMKEGYGGTFTDKQHELINKAYESNERQLKTVNEMLYIANADAGKLRLLKKDIDVRHLVQEAVEEQQHLIKKNNHSIDVQLPNKTLPTKADELFLRMAISNLVSNASKYTMPGGHITIRANETVRYIQISINDDGIGISKDQFPLLFKKFLRLDNELTSQTVGSGLGLYLAQQLVKLHGGSISVVSHYHKGSRFTINLPKSRSSQHPGKKVINHESQKSYRTKSLK